MTYGIIYCITNVVNGKKYIGQTTTTLNRRWLFHKYSAKTGSSFVLHAAIRKYGELCFIVEQISQENSADELNKKEASLIASMRTLVPFGYNLTTGGDRFEHSAETKAKISMANRNRAKRQFCKLGHPFDSVNTYTSPTSGRRSCWTCHYLRNGQKLPQKFEKYLGVK